MEKKGAKTMEEKIKYPFRKTINRLIKNVNVQNPKLYFYFLIFTITATIYPFFSIFLPKLLIEELSLGNMANLENILYIILGYFVISSIVGFVKNYIEMSSYTKISALRINYLADQL